MSAGAGRNSPCGCGSGRKRKLCCDRVDAPRMGAVRALAAKERRHEPFVFVAMPTRGAISIETHMALTSNVGVPHGLFNVARKSVVEARNELALSVLEAVKADAAPFTPSEYFVLWIDDDAWFPAGTVRAFVDWLTRHPEADMLCGFFCDRRPHAPPTAFVGSEIIAPYLEARQGEIQEITACGFHFVVHRASLLERVGPNPFDVVAGARVTEDIAFCDSARAAGARIFCATDAVVYHVDVETGLAYRPGSQAFRIRNNTAVPLEKPIEARSYGLEVDAEFADALQFERAMRPTV